MTGDEQDVVSALRQGLARRIGRERFELWFDQVVLELAGRLLTVRAASQFVLDRLRKQFRTDIAAVAEHTLGSVRVDYAVTAESAASPTTPPVEAEPNSPPRLVQKQLTDEPPPVAKVRRTQQLGSLVIGDCNRVALTAARTIVDRPGHVSPFFVYGPAGSGKSHLLEGICSALRHQTHGYRVLSLSSEQFTSYFLEALRGSGLPGFRRKCREIDLLAIDDLQFFAGKRATLVELQHTIDSLLRRGKQLVLTADRPASELECLSPELAARVSGGLLCGMDPADQATRLGIARQLASRRRVSFDDDVLRLVASHVSGDARQIIGALNRLEATSEALQQPITLDLANEALQDLFNNSRRLVRLPEIEKAVCSAFGLESKALRDSRKTKSISQPRMLAMWLARKYTRAAFSEISEYFGRRSHSTVVSAEKKVNNWVADGATVQLGHVACNVQDAIRRVETQLRTG